SELLLCAADHGIVGEGFRQSGQRQLPSPDDSGGLLKLCPPGRVKVGGDLAKLQAGRILAIPAEGISPLAKTLRQAI
ncbi:MAG TPA: hypothetical protein VMA73_13920, partial [Streptosporangiaceae bacterium]|nr:hypothetical protein [Streptosporangiaceae bacterium]